MDRLSTRTPLRVVPGLSLTALLLTLAVLPCAAADGFSVRATLTPAPPQQRSGNHVLSARLSRPPAPAVMLSGPAYGVTATLAPVVPLVCYGDTIFRDGFNG